MYFKIRVKFISWKSIAITVSKKLILIVDQSRFPKRKHVLFLNRF